MNVYLIDGTFELFRAYFSSPSRESETGIEVGASLGLLRNTLSLLRDPDVQYVACAFDHVIESFRNEMFDGYKTGAGIEPELYAQFPIAERVMQAIGVCTWPMVEFEADDAIATAAFQLAQNSEVDKVIIASPDKDLMQMVQADQVVCWDRIRNKYYDEAGVFEKFGVDPKSMADWLGLVGDSADGIPGIPKWGAKSSATLLAHYKSIAAIPEDPGQWEVKVRGATGLSTNLNQMREEAELYRKLAVLRTDVPIDCSLPALKWQGVSNDLPEVLSFLQTTPERERIAELKVAASS